MQDIKIDGIGKFNGGEYGTINIDGVCQCEGEINADIVEIDGKFKCLGKITTDYLHCNGMAEIKSDLFAKKINVDGYLSISNGSKLYAQDIICDGCISIDGQISSDKINVNGYIYADEIVGDIITVKSNLNKLSKLFMKNSKVKLIEATTIDLKGVLAQTVNGNDIIIGANCEIDLLDCSGTLYIDKKAVVKKITGNYTMR